MEALFGGRRLIIIIAVLFLSVVKAQEGVSIQASIDPKMMFVGDIDRNIEKGTLDLSTRVVLASYQQKYGYWIVFPEFTYSNMPGNLKSYTANVGYTFNTVIPKSELSLTVGWGWLDRYGMTTNSFVTTQSYGFVIFGKNKIVVVSEFRDRTDLKYLYGEGKFGWTLRVGLEVKIL